MASIDDIFSAIQNGVVAINNLSSQLQSVFLQVTTLSTAIPAAGTLTFTSSEAAAFLTVTTSSGGLYHLPLY